jgi:hypothetical protein
VPDRQRDSATRLAGYDTATIQAGKGDRAMNEENLKLEDLLFVSNTIELKPDKKYLLVFKGNMTIDQLNRVLDYLRSHGIHGVGIALHDGQELQVIEAPVKIEPEPDRFWQQLSRDMTINERRAIFAKLAEHLGLAVHEWGNTDDGIKKQFSLDEAKAILAPYKKIEDYL